MKIEEQNDALKRNIKVALERYQFTIECLKEKKMVIDLGCGFGYGCYLLRKAGHEVIGVDISEKAIEYARANYPGIYFVFDLEKEKLPNLHKFDVGVCLEVLCHLKDPQKFIDSLPFDELIISAPIDPNPRDGYFYRLHSLSELQFKELLKDWKILKEFRQKKYLTVYCKKI
jgi:SAM-dependent methyltransferase